jgi:hypothetical protein
MRRPRPSILGFVFGAALIWALFAPVIEIADRHLLIDWRPPLALLALLALLGLARLAGRALWPSVRWLIAALLLLLSVLQFADAAVEHFLDRPLDVYFDWQHVPSLLGLYLDSAGLWRGGVTIAAAIAGLGLVVVLLARAIAAIETAMKAIALPAMVAAIFAMALALTVPGLGMRLVNIAVAGASWRQVDSAWHDFAALHGIDKSYAAALAAPQPPVTPLPGLKGKDVYLVFVESFGTVVLDEPSYRATIEPALQNFSSVVAQAGYQLLSSRLVSPTFGGGSWLAHGTLASGVKLDALLHELVVNGDRKGLPRYLAAAGYRTVEIMPGIKRAYPEGAFWGFDGRYYAAQLGYTGPEFGWFEIPDQYTLAQFTARELTPGHAPLFAQIVLVSSHVPFAPVPPYLDDWSDAGTFTTVPMANWLRIYAPPEWNDLDRSYLDSIAYDLKTLGTWLARLDNNALVIMLGDHQPPDLTRGNKKDWTVPIYVLARDPDLVRPFANLGYGAGAAPPPQVNPEGMEKFLAEFLTGFGPSVATTASAPPQSPDAPALFQR